MCSARRASGGYCPKIFRHFPPWRVVDMTFWRWRNGGLWERIMHELRRRVRVKAGRSPDPTLAIVDRQSVKTVQKDPMRVDGRLSW